MIKEYNSYSQIINSPLVGKLAILKDRENALYTHGHFEITGNPVGWSSNIKGVDTAKGKTLINLNGCWYNTENFDIIGVVDKDYKRKITEQDPYGEEVWESIDHLDIDPYGEEQWDEKSNEFNEGDILICVDGAEREKNNKLHKGRKYTYVGRFSFNGDSKAFNLINVKDIVTGEIKRGWNKKRFKKSLNENVDHSEVDPYGEEVWSDEILHGDIVDSIMRINPGDIRKIENNMAALEITDYVCTKIAIVSRRLIRENPINIDYVVFFNDKKATLTEDEAYDIFDKMRGKYEKIPSVKVNWTGRPNSNLFQKGGEEPPWESLKHLDIDPYGEEDWDENMDPVFILRGMCKNIIEDFDRERLTRTIFVNGERKKRLPVDKKNNDQYIVSYHYYLGHYKNIILNRHFGPLQKDNYAIYNYPEVVDLPGIEKRLLYELQRH